MKIQEAEVINKDNLFNNNIYFIKYQNHKVALYREDKLFVLNRDNSLKEIPYEQSNVFAWYTDYSRNSEILEIMNNPEIEILYKKAQEKVLAFRPKYAAGFLSEETQKTILNNFQHYINNDWKVVCHHMTINLGRIKPEEKHLIGKTHKAKITHIGTHEDSNVTALKVETDIPSVNESKHITLAIGENGKPFMSNQIQNWKEVDNLEIDLKVGEFLHNQKVNFGKKQAKRKTKVNI